MNNGLNCLDNKFWVWETLEEAVRGDVDSMSYEQVGNAIRGFSLHMKGSEELLSTLETRVYLEEAQFK